MKAKRLLSAFLVATVVLSCVMCLAFTPVSAASYSTYAKYQDHIKPENNYGLEDTVNDGKILQAWNWSYSNATKLMKTVAEQGFTTIQISPPNEIKMPTKDVAVCPVPVDGIAPNGWWMYYQPAGFQLNESEDNALGVKSEFIAMCEEADKYGVKIIVDAVINHMGTDDDHVGVYDNTSTNPMDHVNDRASLFEPEILAAKAFHSPWVNMTYKENYWDGWSDYDIEEDLTQHCTSGLPDLATETQLVQDVIYEYFVELVEAGADGFRFDAAKHIETVHDTYFASDFWEDTLQKLRKNYPDVECYAYGEILNKCGDGRAFSEYTELMDVTDSSSYWGIKDAVCSNGNSGNSIPYYPNSNFTKENVIQWNESHDTYIDGGTSSLTVEQRNKIWAVTAARQTITGVYFARPLDTPANGREGTEKLCQSVMLGDANLTSWTNPEVQAVNRFDNFFGDAEEYNSVQNKVTMIERGDGNVFGATLVNLSGKSKAVSMETHILSVGTYTDSLTGNTFTVDSDCNLTGTIGSTGIACLYYADDEKPVVPVKPISIWDIDVSYGQFPTNEDYYTVVFSTRWESGAYYYCWDDNQTPKADWPGEGMKYALVNDYGEHQFVAYVPVEYNYIIINNGQGEQTVDLDLNGNMGIYLMSQVDGKYPVGNWQPDFYEWNPEPFTTAPDTEPSSTDDIGTEPDSQPASSNITDPSQPDEAGILGDADNDGVVNVKDATVIQKVVASIKVIRYNEDVADVDASGMVNVKDATAIQKWVAGMETGFPIGK